MFLHSGKKKKKNKTKNKNKYQQQVNSHVVLTLEIKPKPLVLHLGGVSGVREGRRRVFSRPAPPLLPESISFFGGGGG